MSYRQRYNKPGRQSRRRGYRGGWEQPHIFRSAGYQQAVLQRIRDRQARLVADQRLDAVMAEMDEREWDLQQGEIREFYEQEKEAALKRKREKEEPPEQDPAEQYDEWVAAADALEAQYHQAQRDIPRRRNVIRGRMQALPQAQDPDDPEDPVTREWQALHYILMDNAVDQGGNLIGYYD